VLRNLVTGINLSMILGMYNAHCTRFNRKSKISINLGQFNSEQPHSYKIANTAYFMKKQRLITT